MVDRRRFLANAICVSAGSYLPGWTMPSLRAAEGELPSRKRCRGLLIGGLLGDALGGPLEFSDQLEQVPWLCGARRWDDDEQLDAQRRSELSASLRLSGYEELRPETAPYGPWTASAPAGTLTDDSRHKMVLLRAIKKANQAGRAVTAEDVARQFIQFEPNETRESDREERTLNEEGFREYRFAAHWLLGERDLQRARPLERLWAGVNNCSGQMLLPPLAVRYPGQAEAAYRAAFELNFIDSPMARDMAAALVAGLAAAVAPKLDDQSAQQRWHALLRAMRGTDPFGYAQVPFAGRQLDRWMNKAEELADRAAGRPKELFRLLETEGRPLYWWDAHFTLLVPLSLLHLCDFDALAAMHLTLDFGHDTDSYAQVLGCMAGAVHGSELFPEEMVTAVTGTLASEYGEDVESWLSELNSSL